MKNSVGRGIVYLVLLVFIIIMINTVPVSGFLLPAFFWIFAVLLVIMAIWSFCSAISSHRAEEWEKSNAKFNTPEPRRPTYTTPVQYKPEITISFTEQSSSKGTCEARHRSIRTLSEMKGFKDFVVIDTETTGLSRQSDSIVEIAMIKYENDMEVDRFVTLINPDRPIPVAASRINGIVDADVRSAPRIAEVARHIVEFIGDKYVVGHNAAFDLAFILRECSDYFTEDRVYYIDTIGLAKRAFPSMPDYKLQTLIKELNIAKTQNHRAEADAEYTLALMQMCLGKLIDNEEEEIRKKKEMIAAQLEKCKNSPLYNKKFAFDLCTNISRSEAETALLEVGALYRKNVSGQTDYLVVRNSNEIENKQFKKKLSELEAKGHKVSIIDETKLFELLRDAKDKLNIEE